MTGNIPDAGRAPSNEPEPVPTLQGHEPEKALRCADCSRQLNLDGELRIACPVCGPVTVKGLRGSLAALDRAWPPPSQEARAAAHGLTRTK